MKDETRRIKIRQAFHSSRVHSAQLF